MIIRRRSLVVVVVLLGVALGYQFVRKPTGDEPVEVSRRMAAENFQCPRCNVILLNIELLRADHTGLIGGTELTPNIDRYFRDGVVFHDVSAPGGETFLSNTAVQTGLHPHLVDIAGIKIDKFDRLEESEQSRIEQVLTQNESWAQMLSREGYHTISINQGGRAGGQVFLDRGFADATQWSSDLPFEDMADVLIGKLDRAFDKPLYVLFRPTFLHNHQYRSLEEPDFAAKMGVRVSKYDYIAPDGATRSGVLLKRDRRGADEDLQRAQERSIYASQLIRGDRTLQSVFDVIDRRFPRDTIVVLYANHGSGLGDNGTFNHGTSYQASVHVPLFIRHPGIDGGVHVYTSLSLFDLVPTLSAMIGVGGADWSMLETYDRTIARGGRPDDRPLIGKNSFDEYIRHGDWKLIVRYGYRKSLFNLADDPGETNDLLDDYPDKAVELELMLSDFKRTLYSAHGDPL